MKKKEYMDICTTFIKQAETTPQKTAVVCGQEKLSYEHLNQMSNQLANFLVSKGIKENDIIGIISGRSINLIVGLLGVLKAGATYLPIDVNNPHKRIDYMVENSGAKLVLLTEDYFDNLSIDSYRISSILKENYSTIFRYPSYNQNRNIYCIYTSGSTGYPKGVIIQYKSFMNLLSWFIFEFKLKQFDKNYVISSISFDLAQKNLFCMLMVGGELHLFPSCKLDYTEIISYIKTNQITIINCTPSMFKPIINYCSNYSFTSLISLRYLFLGGEIVDFSLYKVWSSTEYFNCTIVNQYGPTECTDVTLYYIIDTTNNIEHIPIGQPIYNVEVYILDENMNMSDEGELYIGGICTGQYLKQTNSKDSFVILPNISNSRLYRTGDLVKLQNNNLYFCGRKDDQIKRKGHRIELLEIEKQLDKLDVIEKAAVVFNKTEETIIAFFTPMQEANCCKVKSLVKNVLPDWMMPNEFIRLDRIPLTVSGKIDRQILQNYKVFTEKIIVDNSPNEIFLQCCKKVLHRNDITLDSIFLREGGDSLDAISLICMLYEYGLTIESYHMFEKKPIKELLKYVQKVQIKKTITQTLDFVPVSYYQHKYVDYYLKNGFLDFGNSVTQVRTQEIFDVDTFKCKITEYIQNINLLRISLLTKDIFEIMGETSIRFECKRIEKISRTLLDDYIKNLFEYHFDLRKPPYFYVLLIESHNSNQTNIFFVTNSIFFDKVSVDLLINDIIRMYFYNYTPNYLLRDNMTIEQEFISDEIYLKDYNFWRKILSCTKKHLNASNLSNSIEDGNSISFLLNESFYDKIKALCKKWLITSNMFFLAVYAHFIRYYLDEEHIIIGETVSTRKDFNEQNSLGAFVNQIIINIPSEILDDRKMLFNSILKQKRQWKKHNRFPIDYFKLKEQMSIPYRYGYHYWEKEHHDSVMKQKNCEIYYHDSSTKHVIRDLSFTVREREHTFQLLFRMKKRVGLDTKDIQKTIENILASFIL